MKTDDPSIRIRRARPDDAAGIVAVLEAVVAEREYSAIDRVWTIDDERQHLASCSPREAVHVALDETAAIVGLQVLDRWSMLDSISHVGQLGTFLLPAWRGRGVGRALWQTTRAFARNKGYRKLAIYVRGSNRQGQAYYRQLGFTECGRLTGQVVIDGIADDEVVMELHLD